MIDECRMMNGECRNDGQEGFTLIELIGVLAILSILAAMIVPNVIRQLDAAMRDAETLNLETIAHGVGLFLREQLTWPLLLTDLSPEYVAFGNTQITNNDRGFPRYFFVHPVTVGYNNDLGLIVGDVPAARFLLISDISQDAAPVITNATQFDAWWNTDETSTPDLKIYRGHAGSLFHLVSLSATGAGGSYQIGVTATNAGAGTLPSNNKYHLVGTRIGLDEANTYATPEIDFLVALDAGYQFEPNCPAGAKWTTFGSGCSP